MTLQFDRHRPIVSPALAPMDPRESDKVGSDRGVGDRVLTIGLINNMPDAALQATERQFMRLLEAGAGENHIHLHRFSLPSVKRSQSAQWRIEQQYTDIAEIDRLSIDGLMTIGRLVPTAAEARPTFRALRALGERLRAGEARLGPALSMGMTDDFDVAVEEGATIVRVGRALFGERSPIDGRAPLDRSGLHREGSSSGEPTHSAAPTEA